MASAGCVLTDGQPVTRTLPPLTTAAERNGTALDRSGSIDPVPGRDWAGAHPPAVGLRVVDVDAGVAQHRHRHRDMRRRRHRLAGVHDGQSVGERGARQQQPGDELRRGRGVDLDGAAARPIRRRAPGTAGRRRRWPPPVRAARSSSGAMGRARACSSPSNVTVSVLSAATGGTKRSTVPASPQSTRAPGSGSMRPLIGQLAVGAVDRDCRAPAPRRSSGRCRGCAAHR